MPAEPPTFGRSPRDAMRLRPPLESAPTGPAGAASLIAALQADLDRARSEYALRRTTRVAQMLEDIERRLGALDPKTPDVQIDVALIQASLLTLRGRLLSRRDFAAANAAFSKAVGLFRRYADQLEKHAGAHRLLTDYGIALYRIHWRTSSLMDEVIKLLERVCKSGVAPAEAFAYLGYAEWARSNLEKAEHWIRKGLTMAPSDPTILYWLARLAEEQGNTAGVADAYIAAGNAASAVEDFASAARCGMRALRLDGSSESGLVLAVSSYQQLGRAKLESQIVQRFLERQPSSAYARGLQGKLLRESGKPKEAIDVLASIEVSTPELAWVRAELADALLADEPDHPHAALDAVADVLRYFPDNANSLRLKAEALIRLEKYQEAVDALRHAARTDDSPILKAELGRALFLMEDFEGAREMLAKTVEADPRSVGAYWALGQCLERLGDEEGAIRCYRRAAQLDPDMRGLFLALMEVLARTSRYEEAFEEIDERLSGPLHVLALWCKGRILQDRQEWPEALAALEQAAQAAEGAELRGVLVDLGDVQRHTGQYSNAFQTYSRALDIDNKRVDVLVALALYHCNVADYPSALAWLDRARALEESESALFDLQGWCHQHLGDPAAALESFSRAFELSERKNSWYRKGIANALVMLGRHREAEEHFQAILNDKKYQAGPEPVAERPSGNASTLGLLGWCYYRLKRYDEAIRLFKKALSRTTDESLPLWFDLGLALFASGRVELAREIYREAGRLTEMSEPVRRRGLYYVALFDLADANRDLAIADQAGDLLALLQKGLAASGIALTALKWLPEQLRTS